MEWMIAGQDAQGFLEIRIEGDCDLYGAPRFATELLDKIAGGARRLRLDFAGVGYLDSTGVGAIIRLLQAVKKAGGELRFKGIGGSPRRVLKMTGILRLMREDGPSGAAG
jgi:anti-sigma B factor antagonist